MLDSLKAHTYANIFPMIEGAAFTALCDDIRQHGVREPIWLADGKILDGRNRYKAALETGRTFETKEFVGTDAEALDFVISLNLKRRHLDESQRSMVADTLANLKQGGDRRSEDFKTANAVLMTQDAAAAALNVSVDSVQRARTVRAKGTSALAKAVEQGIITVSKAASLANYDKPFQTEVLRKIKDGMKATEAIRLTKREMLPQTVAALPKGKHRVIYCDPPWQYGDARQTDDHRESTGAAHHYATMTISELKELDVAELAAKDCVMLMWATCPLLPEALDLLKAWGFKYKTLYVWDKGHGAFGSYHDAEAELILCGTKGSCVPEASKKVKQIQRWARGRHSAKPEAARAMIDKLWPNGRRIELFRRGDPIKGWKTWGGEAS